MRSSSSALDNDDLEKFCEELAAILIEQALWEKNTACLINNKKCYREDKDKKHGNSRNLR